MANACTLKDQLDRMFRRSMDDKAFEDERQRKLSGQIELFRRAARDVYDRGAAASFEDKVEMALMMRLLDTAHEVLSFVEDYQSNPLLREVRARDRFGDEGASIFEDLTRSGRRAGMLKHVIRETHEKLRFVRADRYSTFSHEAYFTPEEQERISEEGLLD